MPSESNVIVLLSLSSLILIIIIIIKIIIISLLSIVVNEIRLGDSSITLDVNRRSREIMTCNRIIYVSDCRFSVNCRSQSVVIIFLDLLGKLYVRILSVIIRSSSVVESAQ